MRSISFLVAAALVAGHAAAQVALDPGFQDRAMVHVRSLAAWGNRVAGSEGEQKAMQYVQEHFKRLGLEVSVEPFDFKSYVLTQAVFKAGEESVVVERLVFNPYDYDGAEIAGQVELVPPEAATDWGLLTKLDLAGRLVLTKGRPNPYRMAFRKPRAIAFVSDADFDRLSRNKPERGQVVVQGRQVTLRSANVVATLAGTGPEVILSAHLDSVRTPGANDNASGVAVLLELARHYRASESRPNLRFVAFGAEEAGMVGARAFLRRHLEELKSNALLFNLDSVGGGERVYVEMRGKVRGILGKGVNQIPDAWMNRAQTDVDSRWHYIPAESLDCSNVPEWLEDAIRKAAAEAEIELTPANQMGSDHQVFAQAGFVATNIAISGGKNHTPDDTPENISPASLVKAARLVAGVVAKTPAQGPAR